MTAIVASARVIFETTTTAVITIYYSSHLISPSCPYDALTVGSAKAAVNDFTASDATPLIVVSMTKCGGLLFLIDAL